MMYEWWVKDVINFGYRIIFMNDNNDKWVIFFKRDNLSRLYCW